MTSDAQKRAKQKYQSKVKRFTLDFYPTDADIYEYLQAQENKRAFVKTLIREHMNRH